MLTSPTVLHGTCHVFRIVVVVVIVVAHSFPLSSVVVELEKISHHVWIIP